MHFLISMVLVTTICLQSISSLIFDDHFPCSYDLDNQLTQYFSYKEKV